MESISHIIRAPGVPTITCTSLPPPNPAVIRIVRRKKFINTPKYPLSVSKERYSESLFTKGKYYQPNAHIHI